MTLTFPYKDDPRAHFRAYERIGLDRAALGVPVVRYPPWRPRLRLRDLLLAFALVAFAERRA